MSIIIQDLMKSYGKIQAVNGVNLKVSTGEIFGLLGPNGAGKTTLISLLTGILVPDQGTAKICGYDLLTQIEQIKRKISLVPQELAFYEELTALDNLKFFAGLYHLSARETKKRIEEVLEFVQLKDWRKTKVANYSGGMKRRLNLAIGLLNDPQILFLDEPTVGVDPQSRKHILDSIRNLAKHKNRTVFYTTHYIEEAQTLCDCVAIYDHGKVIKCDTPNKLIHKMGSSYIEFEVKGFSQNQKVVSRIKDLPFVKDAVYKKSSSVLSVTPYSSDQCIEEITQRLQVHNIPIVSIQPQEQTLEIDFKVKGFSLDVFFREEFFQRPKPPSVKHAVYKHSSSMLSVTPHSSVQCIEETMRILQANNIPIVSIQTQEQTLETVFLKLTGKALRE